MLCWGELQQQLIQLKEATVHIADDDGAGLVVSGIIRIIRHINGMQLDS